MSLLRPGVIKQPKPNPTLILPMLLIAVRSARTRLVLLVTITPGARIVPVVVDNQHYPIGI